ncbi:MAG: GTPase RsgA, partial [Kiritimatiellae bacterium]|nr:GTPase RsgA [Kiritimatiellia bacterium]
MTRIEEFGWRGEVVPGVARVVSAHGDYFHLVCNEAQGEILARKKKASFGRMKTAAPDDMKGAKRSELQAVEPLRPMTGDFVRFRHNAQGDSMILEVLPRFSHFARKDPGARRSSQTLAVNFDTLFVMMAPNVDFSPPRIDRYLTLAEDRGESEVVVVLTKVDLVGGDFAARERELVDVIAGRARLVKVSALTGQGMDDVLGYVRPR